jgi:hypothetical protein
VEPEYGGRGHLPPGYARREPWPTSLYEVVSSDQPRAKEPAMVSTKRLYERADQQLGEGEGVDDGA